MPAEQQLLHCTGVLRFLNPRAWGGSRAKHREKCLGTLRANRTGDSSSVGLCQSPGNFAGALCPSHTWDRSSAPLLGEQGWRCLGGKQ